MAEDDSSQKKEDPTPKRQSEAREKGQVGKSREIDHWVMILAATLALVVFGPKMVDDLKRVLVHYLEMPHAVAVHGGALTPLLMGLAVDVGLTLAPIVAVLVVAAVGAGLLQHALLLAPDLIKPQFSKISPAAGLKRIFSIRGVVEFLKSTLKL